MDFNLDTAIFLADLSVRAYREPEKFNYQELNLELISYFDVEKTHTQAYIFRKEKNIYVVFRGTESIRDVMYDFMIIKKKFPKDINSFFKPKIHHGFLYAFQSVEPQLFKKINELQLDEAYNIYVTGHSLGAALAILCAFQLKYVHGIDTIMYNFGCPRIGNRIFINLYNGLVTQSFRIVNDDDTVTNLPKFGYKHVNTLVYIHRSGKLIVNPSRWRRLYERFDDLYHFFTGDAMIDHLEHNYLENLRKIKEKS